MQYDSVSDLSQWCNFIFCVHDNSNEWNKTEVQKVICLDFSLIFNNVMTCFFVARTNLLFMPNYKLYTWQIFYKWYNNLSFWKMRSTLKIPVDLFCNLSISFAHRCDRFETEQFAPICQRYIYVWNNLFM